MGWQCGHRHQCMFFLTVPWWLQCAEKCGSTAQMPNSRTVFCTFTCLLVTILQHLPYIVIKPNWIFRDTLYHKVLYNHAYWIQQGLVQKVLNSWNCILPPHLWTRSRTPTVPTLWGLTSSLKFLLLHFWEASDQTIFPAPFSSCWKSGSGAEALRCPGVNLKIGGLSTPCWRGRGWHPRQTRQGSRFKKPESSTENTVNSSLHSFDAVYLDLPNKWG